MTGQIPSRTHSEFHFIITISNHRYLFLSHLGKTKNGNFSIVLLNKWQSAPTFFCFFSFPLAFDFTAELETLCRVTAWWEHNWSKTKEHWDKVNFTKVFCETSWSHGEMLVTNFSACIIILELPLYYKLYHIDISTNESPQKQQKPERHSNIQEQEEKKSNLFLLPDSYHHFLVLLLLFSWFILFLRINWFFFP